MGSVNAPQMAESQGEMLCMYADGVLEILNLGLNTAVTFFAYERGEAGEIVKAPVLRLVMPKTSFKPEAIAATAAEQPDPRAVPVVSGTA